MFSKKKRGPQNFFSGDLKKRSSQFFSGEKGLQTIFFRRSLLEETKKRSLQIFCKVSGAFQRNFNGPKIVLSSSRGQANFRGLEASRPKPRTSKCVLEDTTSDKYTVGLLNCDVFAFLSGEAKLGCYFDVIIVTS